MFVANELALKSLRKALCPANALEHRLCRVQGLVQMVPLTQVTGGTLNDITMGSALNVFSYP